MPRNIRTSPPPLQRAGLRWLSHSTAPHCTPHSSTGTTPNLARGIVVLVKQQVKGGGAKWGKNTSTRRVAGLAPTTGAGGANEAGVAVRPRNRGRSGAAVGRSGGTTGGAAERGREPRREWTRRAGGGGAGGHGAAAGALRRERGRAARGGDRAVAKPGGGCGLAEPEGTALDGRRHALVRWLRINPFSREKCDTGPKLGPGRHGWICSIAGTGVRRGEIAGHGILSSRRGGLRRRRGRAFSGRAFGTRHGARPAART